MTVSQQKPPPPPPTRVLVADDHPVVRQGLRQILADTAEMTVAGETTNVRDTLERIRRDAFDVVVLDLVMPDGTALDVLEAVRRERPELAVLVLSMHPEDQYGLRVLKAGAAGYLTKESAPEELVQAIRKVRAGGKYVTARMAEKLAQYVERPADGPLHELLSHREYQVLRLLASAKTVKQIARELHLSDKTISTYRARVLAKMGLTSTAHLVRYAVQHRLVD